MAEILVTSNVKRLPPSHYTELFEKYLENYEMKQIEQLVLSTSGTLEHKSILVYHQNLLDFNSQLAFYFVYNPQSLMNLFEEALRNIQHKIIKNTEFKRIHSCKGSVKIFCHVRVVSLPPHPTFTKRTINDVNCCDTNSFIQLSGTIIRTGGNRMLDVSKDYICEKCQYRFTVSADFEQGYVLPQPRICPSTSKDQNNKTCKSMNLREIEGSRKVVDYQEIKIQDKIDRLDLGTIPRTIIIIVEADLVDLYNPGDDVIIVGTILRQWKPVASSLRCNIEIAIRTHSLIAMKSNEKLKLVLNDTGSRYESFWNKHHLNDLAGRDLIIQSVCPQLYGMYYVKLCLLLTLIGGSIKTNESENGTVRRRYQSHMLLIGDPGCG